MLFGAGMIDYAPNIGDGRTPIVLDVREDARFRYVDLWDTTAPGGGPPDFTSVRDVLSLIADLSPDLEGTCRRVSVGWTFTATPAGLDPG